MGQAALCCLIWPGVAEPDAHLLPSCSAWLWLPACRVSRWLGISGGQLVVIGWSSCTGAVLCVHICVVCAGVHL